MNREMALAYVRALRVTGVDESSVGENGWLRFCCPLAPVKHENGRDTNPSMGISLGANSRVHCFACDFHGSGYDLLLELKLAKLPGDFRMALAIASSDVEVEVPWFGGFESSEPERKQLHLFDEVWCGQFVPAFYEHNGKGYVHPYLEKRGVSYQVAKTMDFRLDEREGRVGVPVRDFDGRLYGFHGRAVEAGVNPVYRMYRYDGHTNASVWLGEHWVDTDKPVLMVESVFDVARALEVAENVICPLTASLGFAKLQRMRDVFEVVTVFDRDKAGDAARARCSGTLNAERLVHLKPPVGYKDVGEVPVEELRVLIDGLVETK